MLLDPKIPAKVTNLLRTYNSLRWEAVAPVEMEMAETREHFRGIPPEDADLSWRRAEPGQAWGDDWVTAWFRGRAAVPDYLEGQPVFLRAETGAPESLFLVDGRHYGVFDENHPVRLLTLEAKGGGEYDVHLEGYAGHSFPGTQPFDGTGLTNDPGVVVTKDCRKFNKVEIVTERADVSAFLYDLRTLTQLAQALDANSLRRGRIQAAMERIFVLAYAKPHETHEDRWRPALAEAREVMRPLLELKNGPTAPQFGIVGHSHIDTAWLWPVPETWRKCARTFSSVLSLMDQYPDFKFTMSAAYHADLIRQAYPDIFERIQQRVKEGRWEINGAMWVEPDCNIPSGEAFVRQCLVGQRATREMFGVTSDTLWQPDVFGYSAALPQILRGCGVEFFCTTKLSWNDTNHFPYDTFEWQGIDGSTVLSHFNLIHCWPDPETLVSAWNGVQHKDVQDRRLLTFGYGDGGGGPMAEMIEMGHRTEDLEGCPRAEYATVSSFMQGCRDELTGLPRWVGELYLELHRGTLTAIAEIKRLNRRAEFALRDAEFAAVLADLRNGADYPKAALLETWKKLLVNQFHDILPGTSIAAANDQAVSELNECLAEADGVRDVALQSLAGGDDGAGILLLNSLSWDRTGETVLEGLPKGQIPSGEGIAAQPFEDVDGRKKVAVTGLDLPSLGYRTVPLTEAASPTVSPFSVTENEVETPYARVRFDAAGRIVSFFDKASRRELVSAGGAFNVLLMGEDVPQAWDNWDIDRDQRLKLAPQDRLVSRDIVANGPLQLRIRQVYELGTGSTFTQDVVFHSTTPRVDFDTVVDWSEKYQFLKVGFAPDVLAETARHEIQFGHVARNTHDNTTWDRAQFDVCAHKWTDVSETGFGIAFLNDCKYGCTVKDGEYRLSLIKSGMHPDPRGDEGRHRFRYAMLPHTGGFSVESVVRPAYEFNVPPVALPASASDSEPFRLATVDASNVIVEAVKGAEEGDGFVLRLYEAGKTGTHATVRFGLPVTSAQETDMLEENPRDLEVTDGAVELYFRPFEIKTIRCSA